MIVKRLKKSPPTFPQPFRKCSCFRFPSEKEKNNFQRITHTHLFFPPKKKMETTADAAETPGTPPLLANSLHSRGRKERRPLPEGWGSVVHWPMVSTVSPQDLGLLNFLFAFLLAYKWGS